MSDETLHNIEGLLVEIVKRLDLILTIHSATAALKRTPSPSSDIRISSEGEPPSLSFPSKADIDWAVSEWNELAADAGLPEVLRVTAQRKRALTARLRELGSREAWTDALMQVAKSPFCCGENDRGWRANFDFVLRPSAMAKLLEGTYGKV